MANDVPNGDPGMPEDLQHEEAPLAESEVRGWFDFGPMLRDFGAGPLLDGIASLLPRQADEDAPIEPEILDAEGNPVAVEQGAIRAQIANFLTWMRGRKQVFVIDEEAQPPVGEFRRLRDMGVEAAWDDIEAEHMSGKKARKHINGVRDAAKATRNVCRASRVIDFGDFRIPWTEIRVPVTLDMIGLISTPIKWIPSPHTWIPAAMVEATCIAIPAVVVAKNSIVTAGSFKVGAKGAGYQAVDVGLGLVKAVPFVGAATLGADILYDSVGQSEQDFADLTEERYREAIAEGLPVENLDRVAAGYLESAEDYRERSAYVRQLKRSAVEWVIGLKTRMFGDSVNESIQPKRDALLDRLYPGTKSGTQKAIEKKLETTGLGAEEISSLLEGQFLDGYIHVRRMDRLRRQLQTDPSGLLKWLQGNEEVQLRLYVLLEQERVSDDLAARIRRMEPAQAKGVLDTLEGKKQG